MITSNLSNNAYATNNWMEILELKSNPQIFCFETFMEVFSIVPVNLISISDAQMALNSIGNHNITLIIIKVRTVKIVIPKYKVL